MKQKSKKEKKFGKLAIRLFISLWISFSLGFLFFYGSSIPHLRCCSKWSLSHIITFAKSFNHYVHWGFTLEWALKVLQKHHFFSFVLNSFLAWFLSLNYWTKYFIQKDFILFHRFDYFNDVMKRHSMDQAKVKFASLKLIQRIHVADLRDAKKKVRIGY